MGFSSSSVCKSPPRQSSTSHHAYAHPWPLVADVQSAVITKLIRDQAILDAAERRLAKAVLMDLLAGSFYCGVDAVAPVKRISVKVLMHNAEGHCHPDLPWLSHHQLLNDLLLPYGIRNVTVLDRTKEAATVVLEMDTPDFVVSMRKIRESFTCNDASQTMTDNPQNI